MSGLQDPLEKGMSSVYDEKPPESILLSGGFGILVSARGYFVQLTVYWRGKQLKV